MPMSASPAANLTRGRQVLAAAFETDPERAEQRRKQDDENRAHALQNTGRHLPTEQHAVGVAFGKERERGAGLLLARGIQGIGDEERDHDEHPAAFGSGQAGEINEVDEISRREQADEPGCHGRQGGGVDAQAAGQHQRSDRECRRAADDDRQPGAQFGVRARLEFGRLDVTLVTKNCTRPMSIPMAGKAKP